MTPRTAALIAEYRRLLVDDSPAAWLFPSENLKTPLRYSNVFRRYIRPAFAKVGLGQINFQAMRRTFASQSHAVGVKAKTRSDIMGSTVDVHENEYTHTPFDTKQQAMQEAEKRLFHKKDSGE